MPGAANGVQTYGNNQRWGRSPGNALQTENKQTNISDGLQKHTDDK